jgi:hypothetical protein
MSTNKHALDKTKTILVLFDLRQSATSVIPWKKGFLAAAAGKDWMMLIMRSGKLPTNATATTLRLHTISIAAAHTAATDEQKVTSRSRSSTSTDTSPSVVPSSQVTASTVEDFGIYMASSDELTEKEKAVRASLQQFPTTTFYLQLADGAWISEPLKITKARGDAWRYLQASIPIRDRHIVAHIAIMDVFSFFHYMVTTYERTDQTYQRSMTTKFHAMKLDNNERGDHFIQRVLDSQQHLEYLGVTVNQDQARTLILDGLAWNPSATGEKRRESVYKTVIDKLDTQSKLLNRQMLLHEYRQAIIQRDVELDDVMGSDRWEMGTKQT